MVLFCLFLVSEFRWCFILCLLIILLVRFRLLSDHLLGYLLPTRLAIRIIVFCLFVILFIFRFGFESGICHLIFLVPVHCFLNPFTTCFLRSLTICYFSYFPFRFYRRDWVLIASVPGLCLLISNSMVNKCLKIYRRANFSDLFKRTVNRFKP